MLCISGHPYDTLEEVIGQRPGHQTGNYRGSLLDWGIGYSELELLYGEEAHAANGDIVAFDFPSIEKAIEADPKIQLIHIQRSCGFQWRPSIPVQEIGRLCSHIKEKYKSRELVIFVDNCYGELVEELEPCHVGADLIAGSLIKNLGGTLAPCGGYIAGRQDLVQRATVHLSAPGVDGGATFNMYRYLFQGLFMAPSIVGESLKGAMLVSEVMDTNLGFSCNPKPKGHRTDIIQAVRLGSRERLIAFCEAVQRKSPVGAHIRCVLDLRIRRLVMIFRRPIPGMSPGYGDEVIFADGTFIDGSTLELSADGPLREPYVAYTQGCTHWTHWAIVLQEALNQPAFQRNTA